jgi:hypothetical protein
MLRPDSLQVGADAQLFLIGFVFPIHIEVANSEPDHPVEMLIDCDASGVFATGLSEMVAGNSS